MQMPLDSISSPKPNNSDELVHVWSECHGCGMRPIVGLRFECFNCPAGPNNTLCAGCYSKWRLGFLAHPESDSGRKSVHNFTSFDGIPVASYKDWFQVPMSTKDVPVHPSNGFVVRPEFCISTGSYFGSYAFVVSVQQPEVLVLLTAMHVMDELAKSVNLDCRSANRSFTGSELPALIEKVTIFDVFSDNWMLAELGAATQMLTLPDARIGDEEPFSFRDIAAFSLSSRTNLSPANLAKVAPSLGVPVWLVLDRKPDHVSNAIRATVVEVSEHTLIYRFERGIIPPKFSSGAPLIDSSGMVAGINIGVGFLKGECFGHANSVTSIKNHLGILT